MKSTELSVMSETDTKVCVTHYQKIDKLNTQNLSIK